MVLYSQRSVISCDSMIQCNVATGHYPIREIVLRVLISDIHTSEVCCTPPSHWSAPPSQLSDWLLSRECLALVT